MGSGDARQPSHARGLVPAIARIQLVYLGCVNRLGRRLFLRVVHRACLRPAFQFFS
jgi:hypothetical protein